MESVHRYSTLALDKMPQQRSRPTFLATIFDWLKTKLAPVKAEESPKEKVLRSLVLSGKSSALMPLNLVQEIEDVDVWALSTMKLTPLSYRDRSTVPIKSPRELWYLFLHKIPPSQRNQPTVVLQAAGQEFKLRRSQNGPVFGVYRLTVLHVADKADQSTWQPAFVEQLKFNDDAQARDFMNRLGTMLLVKRCKDVVWLKIVEEMLKRSRLGYNKRLWDEKQLEDPYGARRDR